MAANVGSNLSSSEASAAEIISKMSEYQFIAVVQDGNSCEPMEQVVNEKGEVVAINTDEYYETIGQSSAGSIGIPAVSVELNFDADGINDLKSGNLSENVNINNVENMDSETIIHAEQVTTEVPQSSTEIDNNVNVDEGDDIISPPQEQKQQQPATNCNSLKDILLPLGIKIPEDHKLEIGSKRKRPKSSIFVGCSTEASQVIHDFEQLKERLQLSSNLEMLKHMVKVENKYLNSTVVTTECMVDDGNKNTKAILELLSSSTDINNKNHLDRSLTNSLESENPLISNAESRNEEVTINILNEPIPDRTMAQNEMTDLLGLTALNVKTIQLSKKYLEHIVKQGFYLSGFINCAEKLDEFLRYFRIITGSAFSIRRSKAKINDDPEPELKPLRKYKPGYLGKGQIKWEKNIGIPPIPFTGIPFTTEGTTTYQCIYGPKRSKAYKQFIDEQEDNSTIDASKKRKTHRESKKKDCPAQIHIRTVHRFPTYNCMSNNIQPIKTSPTTTYVSKCQRGIILAQLREDITGEKVKGEQGFWVRVPLPEVHQNHSLGPFDGDEPPLTEDTLIEMKTLLHNAAISS